MKYLLDTNICIYYMKGLYNLDDKIEQIGSKNCYISEITLAELKFGIANSKKKKQNKDVLDNFINEIKIIPIYSFLDLYAIEKTRLNVLLLIHLYLIILFFSILVSLQKFYWDY